TPFFSILIPAQARARLSGLFLADASSRKAEPLPECAPMNALQERLEALFSISTEISSTLQLEEVLQRVVAHACRLMEARVSSLLLIDKEEGTLCPAATYGASAAYLAQPAREIDATLVGEVVK